MVNIETKNQLSGLQTLMLLDLYNEDNGVTCLARKATEVRVSQYHNMHQR